LKVLLFAAARQRVGTGAVEIDIALPASVAELEAALVARYPDISSLASTSRWAVDQCFVDASAMIHGTEEIALIPPVSGG